MTDFRAAALQALEALGLAQTDVHWELNSPTRKFLRKAEKALRSALAEPVQKPVQEPLCWAVQALEALEWIEPSVLRAALAEPVQEPLSIVEIIGHTCECVDDGTFNMDCAIDFARAIERAHNIGT